MVLVLEADLIFVRGAETAAEILLQLDFSIYRAAVHMNIEDRHEDDDLPARPRDELVGIVRELRNLLHRAVRRRKDRRLIPHNLARWIAEEIEEI